MEPKPFAIVLVPWYSLTVEKIAHHKGNNSVISCGRVQFKAIDFLEPRLECEHRMPEKMVADAIIVLVTSAD